MDRRLRSALPIGVTVALAACGGEAAAPEPGAVDRDSAGVVVTELAWPGAAAPAAIEVEAVSLLSLGGLDAPADAQFYAVRGGRVLGDGAVALFDGGAQEVRIHDRDGSLRARWGRQGEGPGEFTGGMLLGSLPGDTLVVWDAGQRRLSMVHPETGFVRSVTAEEEAGGFPVGVGLLAGGRVVFGGGLMFSSDDGFPQGRFRSDSDYATLHVDGTPGPRVGAFPGPELFARTDGRSFSARSLPFGLRTVAAASDSLVWIATGEAWEIRGWAPGGDLRRIVRADAPLVPVGDALVARWIDEQLADVEPTDRAEQRRALEELPTGRHVPPFDALVAGPGGELWARDGTLPGESTAGWTVLDGRGRIRARLELPTRWRLLDVGRDHLLVADRDELDVERVHLHALRRAPGG